MLKYNLELCNKKEENLDWKYLDSILKYRRDGQLIWKVNCKRVKAGDVAGSLDKSGYIRITIDSIQFQAHRLIWFLLKKYWPKNELDHKDEDKSNNRIGNLREATTNQNQHNKGIQKNNTSGYKGVSWCKRDEVWIAKIKFRNKIYFIEAFSSPYEGHLAYKKMAKHLHKKFVNAG